MTSASRASDAASDREVTSTVENLFDLLKKDKTAVTVKMGKWGEKDVTTLKNLLSKLTDTPDKRKQSKLKGRSSESEVSKMIDKIKTKLEEHEDNGVRLNLDSIRDAIDLLAGDLHGLTFDDILTRWKVFDAAVEQQNIVKAMFQFEQGRLIYQAVFTHGKTTEDLARAFDKTERRIRDYNNYYCLCSEFPGLLFCSYTMGSIMRVQTPIKQRAANDERFNELLKMQHETVEVVFNKEKNEKRLGRWFEELLDTSCENMLLDETTGVQPPQGFDDKTVE